MDVMIGVNFLVAVGGFLLSLRCFQLLWYFIEHDIETLCEIDAKPLIYGEEQCENIFKHNFYVTENALLTLFVALFSPKIIIKGTLGEKPVYLKKLAKDLDMKMAEKEFRSTFRHFRLDKKLIPFIIEHMNEMVIHQPVNNIENKIQLCPEATDIRKMLVHLPNYTSFDVYKYVHIWTSLKVNPEPVILQILQAPEWPVPRYYGSCGRLAAVEDCGITVTNHYHSPWSVRADISRQILVAAIKFTLGHPELAFYITDSSPDNIAVDKDGVIKFIDLENIIVVDKYPSHTNHIPGWHVNHTSENMECINCYSFSPASICEHQISDHNIFTMCKEILHNTSLLLPGGLLHDKSSSHNEEFGLQYLLQECIEPTQNRSRFSIANRIIELLKNS